MTQNRATSERDDVETLLPWHAAGTLSRRDADRVEAALTQDPELAKRFALVREELAETIHLNETLGAPSARAMEKLFAGIDAEAPRAHKVSFNFGSWLSGIVAGFQPRTLAFAGTAALALLVLQTGVITSVMLNRGETPELASYRGLDEVLPAPGLSALVRFAPQASAGDITRFLEANKATLIDGPRAGMFRIRLAEVQSKDDLAKAVARVQNEKALVTFVAPADRDRKPVAGFSTRL